MAKLTIMQNSDHGKRILVTGGAGFIGSHLTDALLHAGYQVTVLDNLSNGTLANLAEARRFPTFKFIKGDILSTEDCTRAATGVDFIFHLACLGVRNSIHSPFENHRVNAEGSLKILESACRAGVQHFFYVSTSEVYGRTTSFPITENALTNPLTVYGASKLAGEHYTNAFYECYGLPSTVLRIFNNYGPRAHYEGDAGEIIPRSIVKVLYDESPVLFGNGEITRDFFFVKDTALALLQLLESLKAPGKTSLTGQTYNIGRGVEITMKALLEQILALMGKDELRIQFLADRPADVPRLWVKPAKFVALTAFKPSYSFESGLEETIAYYTERLGSHDLINEIEDINWIK